jgi:hypothetical protein
LRLRGNVFCLGNRSEEAAPPRWKNRRRHDGKTVSFGDAAAHAVATFKSPGERRFYYIFVLKRGAQKSFFFFSAMV